MADWPDPRETRRLEHWVHWSLLAGLVVSGLLMIAGLILALARPHPSPLASRHSSWAALRNLAHADRATVLLDVGLLALIATPVIRVIVLGSGWAAIGQWRFAAVALAVLALLGVSLMLGFG